jgi:ankyrin repeat protein
MSGDTALLDVRDAEMARVLIELGAAVDVRHPGDDDTPLIRAARMGLTPLVQVLLAAGANVHAEMKDGTTALQEAERGEHAEVVSLLRAAGAGDAGAPVERPR